MALTIPSEPMTVELDPARWDRNGGDKRDVYLLGEDGRMCCWGFACLALGATEDQIRGRAEVSSVDPEFGGRVNLAEQYEINDGVLQDYADISDDERIRRLNEDAEAHHLPVRFVLKGAA
jgi:hypothetical protein